MDSVNNFLEMNGDMSKMYLTPKQYIKAENLRPITDLGGSNGSLVNIKGNICDMTFPQVRGVYKLSMTGSKAGSITITINGETTQAIATNSNTTINEIYNHIKTLSNFYNGSYATAYSFTACVNGDYLFIYQQPEYVGCSAINSVEPTITINVSSGTVRPVFTDSNGIEWTTQQAYVPASLPDDPLVVLGSTTINDVLYILTCNSYNVSGTGQIWEMSYNQVQQQSTLKLLYHNSLGFSADHSVPPSAFVGRYEIPTIQRIYWTDNYNPIRSVNVKQTNLMGEPVELINSTPSIKMSIPMLSDINNGAAVTPLNTNATYQLTYRLKKGNSTVTNFSIPSALVVPIPYNTDNFMAGQPNFASVDGVAGVTADKSIEWTVEGVDPNFDVIEFFIIYRAFPSEDVYTINKYEEQTINGNTTITTEYTNDLNLFEEISMSEFLIETGSFTHAKTIEQKDNRLFYANVKSELSAIVDTFDARTYRFNSLTTNANVKRFETDAKPIILSLATASDYELVAETDDNIPAYNLGMDTDDNPDVDLTCKYQRNSTTIGGEGPNIKYRFGQHLLKSDVKANLPAITTPGSFNEGSTRDVNSSANVPGGFANGYRIPGNNGKLVVSSYSNGAPFQTYTSETVKESMAFEFLNGTFRGYQLNEIYRFGIVFYGKNGTTSFAKWIGDIKFPTHGDIVPSDLQPMMDSGTKVGTFKSMATEGNTAYSCIPYIEFEVNIPQSLTSAISGYQIVRVQRKAGDKVFPGQGLVTQSMILANGNSCMPVPNKGLPNGTNSMDPDTGTSGGKAWNNEMLFECFDYLVDKTANFIEDNDKIILTEKYAAFNNGGINGNGSAGVVWPESGSPPSAGATHINYFHIKKYYNHIQTYNTIYKLSGGVYAEQGDTVNQPSLSRSYINKSLFSSGTFFSKGSPVHALAIKTPFKAINWSDFNGGGFDVVDGKAKMVALHYKPSKLKSQYGGRTYLARTDNEYITCSAYYRTDDLVGTSTIKVFGGDIYYGIIDCQRAIKEDVSPAPIFGGCSQTWYFPASGTRNIDLRVGIKVNSDLNDETSPNARDRDEYYFNDGYSYENTIHRYLSKPSEFNFSANHYNRIYWSEIKINAEFYDNWRIVGTNSFYDLDGNHGQINALITLKNNVYAIQERALAYLMISPHVVVNDENNQPFKMGVGDVLEKHAYLSTDSGTSHQWSVCRGMHNITFINVRHKKIYHFDGTSVIPTSDIKGSRGFLNRTLEGIILTMDNPIRHQGINVTYDFKNNEYLYTFHNLASVFALEKYTLVYSDLTDSFTSFYTAMPYVYLNNNSHIWSLRDYHTTVTNKVYRHNTGNYCEFYGTTFNSTLKTAVNTGPVATKVFDNLSWSTESTDVVDPKRDPINDIFGEDGEIPQVNDTFSRIRCYNEYQNTDWITLAQAQITGTLRRNEQGWNVQIPRNKVNYDNTVINTRSIFDPLILTKTTFGERMRDKYLIVDLEYDNTPNNRFIIHNLKSTFRVSDR